MIFLKKKHHRKSRQTKLFKCARDICNLHSCYNSHSRYMRVHSFSANQMSVIFHVHYCMKNQLVFKNFKFILMSFQKEHVGLKRVERSGMFDESYS